MLLPVKLKKKKKYIIFLLNLTANTLEYFMGTKSHLEERNTIILFFDARRRKKLMSQ